MNKIPTAENIVIVIYDALKPHINPDHELAVTLYETPRNFVRYSRLTKKISFFYFN